MPYFLSAFFFEQVLPQRLEQCRDAISYILKTMRVVNFPTFVMWDQWNQHLRSYYRQK